MSDSISSSVVRAKASTLADFISNNIATSLSISNPNLTGAINSAIISYISVTTPNDDIPLSGVSLDFETNKANLQTLLIGNPVWLDTVNAETGEIIIEMIATALTYMQMAVVRAAQETMFDTMQIDSSMLAGTRFLGVRIARNIPAQHPVTFTRTGDISSSLEIAPYTQFSASTNSTTLNLFNRDAIIFPANVNTLASTYLFEGTIGAPVAFFSTGAPNQYFVLGDNNYAISDLDIVCTVGGQTWNRTAFADYFNIGFWEYASGDQVFSDETTADGNVEISFGNGKFGQIPPANSLISIVYVTTLGAGGNVNLTGGNVANGNIPNVIGTITDTGVFGTNALTPSEYKTLSPGLYSAKYRGVTLQDHAAIARRYPGVIDAIFEGQQILAPSDLRQMMVSRCTLLTNTAWSTNNLNQFLAWIMNLDIANMQVYGQFATQVVMNVSANVYCFNSSDLTSLKNKIISNLQKAFVPKSGILGYKRTVSDIEKIIRRTDQVLIDYYDILAPTTDVTVANSQYVVLGSITINTYYTDRVGY